MRANKPTQLWFGTYYRRSPFFQATQEAGALAYDIYNHMLLPAGYSDTIREYWQIREKVAVWDVSVERQIEITGPDAFAFTNYLTVRDLTRCRVWQCRYALLTDERGGIINDPVLARLGENHFWLALADSDALLWAKGVAHNSEWDVEIREPDVSPLQIQGPKSRDVMHRLFGDSILKLKYYYCMEATLDGIPVLITRTGWTGEVGYEIYLRDGSRGLDLWERVMEAGRPDQIRPTAPSDIRRIEAGILNYGSDMTLENNPYEVGLGWQVKLNQAADFIGKDALRAINAQGVSRMLVGIEIHGEALESWPEYYWPVQIPHNVRDRPQGPIGHVTAAVHSPGLERNIGYAYVPLEFSQIGVKLTVEAPWGDLAASVVPKPFFDPQKKIPKS